jgi:hypothetical protein
VEGVRENPDGVQRHLITDSLQLEPLKFKIKYQADIIEVTEDTVHTEAYQVPDTYITNITKVTPRDDGVHLQETITMKSPDLLFGYAFKQAETSHEEMLERIKRFVEQN